MLKIKTKPGKTRDNEPIELDCSDYLEPSENEWHTFVWLLERSVLSDTLELCGRDGLTTVLNNKTVAQQSRFVTLMPLQERCTLMIQVNNCIK